MNIEQVQNSIKYLCTTWADANYLLYTGGLGSNQTPVTDCHTMSRWFILSTMRHQLLRVRQKLWQWRLHVGLWSSSLSSAVHRKWAHSWSGVGCCQYIWLVDRCTIRSSESTKLGDLCVSTLGAVWLWLKALNMQHCRHPNSYVWHANSCGVACKLSFHVFLPFGQTCCKCIVQGSKPFCITMHYAHIVCIEINTLIWLIN